MSGYRFGDFELRPASYELARGGEPIHVEPRVFELLAYLVTHPGRVVGKQELLDRIWQRQAVSEAALTGAVRDARRALAGGGGRDWIQTVHGRGYRFAGEVEVTGEERSVASVAADLAVLPFENRTGDRELDYLGDGIAESVLGDLGDLPELRVVGRASAARLGAGADALEAGRRIGVRHLLTGRLYAVGGRRVVRAELTRVADGVQLWGRQIERGDDDLLRVQEEISHEIAAALVERLSPDRSARLTRRLPRDPAAYEANLRGRFHLHRRTASGFRQAIVEFRSAIEADPLYALAYSGLADAWALQERYGRVPPAEAMPLARAAAQRALELDDSLAEAHCSLALYQWYYGWDLEASERSLRRAIELGPGYSTAHHWLAFALGTVGRFAEADVEIARARVLDPLSPIVHTNAGTLLYWQRRHDAAIALLRATIELTPGFAVAHQWLSRALLAAGDREGGVRHAWRALELIGDDAEAVASLAHALAVAGRPEEASAVEARLDGLASTGYVPPYWRAVARLGAGDRAAALDQLELALADRFDWLLACGVEPTLDPLRDEPRFHALAARVRPAAP